MNTDFQLFYFSAYQCPQSSHYSQCANVCSSLCPEISVAVQCGCVQTEQGLRPLRANFSKTALLTAPAGIYVHCPPNSLFRTCGSACPPSCDLNATVCHEACVQGCFCDPGFLRSPQGCLQPQTRDKYCNLNSTFWIPDNCDPLCICGPATGRSTAAWSSAREERSPSSSITGGCVNWKIPELNHCYRAAFYNL